MKYIYKALYHSSFVLDVTSRDGVYPSAMRPIENKAILIFFARGSGTEIFDCNVVVLNSCTCIVRRAEYRDAALRCGSILTTERVRTRGGHKPFG
jgi:hypothetical protein